MNKRIVLDFDSTKSYINLLNSSHKFTIVCGAGLSVSSGLPTWNKYLKKIISIFLLHWKFKADRNPFYNDRVPKNMSIAMAEDIFLEDFKNEDIDKYLDEDPLVLAQLIKNCIEPRNWKWMLRKSLYNDYQKINYNSDLINEICNLVIDNNKFITSIMTYNYDDLLKIRFDSKKFYTKQIVKENHFDKIYKFPIYHMHGILPIKGGLDSKIYLSEEDYLTDIIEPNSWYNQLHGTKFTSTTCLFIGLSFNDPSLKRKLAIHRLEKDHFHYALLTHKEEDYEKKKFLLLKNELLRLNVRVIKYPYDISHYNLINLIKDINESMKKINCN